MSLFVSGKINILVCTSIIESGIDVPSANCIIITNSHLFGLSQLYQMRGRIGRSSLQAYAYLLIPNNISLSNTAYKRIKSIEQNTRLGSGYNIAYSDMEIRGSGALFGYKQSGGSGSVGYEMYTRLIQDALCDTLENSLSTSIHPENVDVRFFSKRFIPENYIPSEEVRLSIYKNLFLAFDSLSLDGLTYSLVDRFGELPVPVQNLLNESQLRSVLASTCISSVVRRGCGVVINIKGADIVPESFFELLSEYWGGVGICYHIIPIKESYVSFCVHLLDDEDSYSLFLKFIDKFVSWEKLVK
jgi:transcription-repair coupling factor (superfamily II helicase)